LTKSFAVNPPVEKSIRPIPPLLSILTLFFIPFGQVFPNLKLLAQESSTTLSDSTSNAKSAMLLVGGHRFDTKSGKFVRNKGIVISAGVIQSMIGRTSASNLQRQILAEDDYILPGFIDLHAHYNVRLFKKRREEFHVLPIVYLANGATVTFSAGELDPQAMQKLRTDIESGKKIGPRLINSGPYFGRARPDWGRQRNANQIVEDVRHWAPLVGGFKAKSIRPDELKILIKEAHSHQLTVTGHLGSGFRQSVNPRDAIEMGIDRIEHFLGGDALPNTRSAYSSLKEVQPAMPEILSIIRFYVEKGIWFDATLSAYGYFGKRGEEYEYWIDERKFFTDFVRAKLKGKERTPIETFEKIYQVKQKTIRAFYEAGGKITLGTDHFSDGSFLPGFGVHRELDALVRSGIPPVDAIRIATINGARALGIDKNHGSLETGKSADLYVVSGNPLKNIRNTRNGKIVVRAGKVYQCDSLLRGVQGKLGPHSEQEIEGW
jgi:imidazolonepropionase-like amidohydrolase